MRTFLDTSTGYGTACVIGVKGGGNKFVIFSAVSISMQDGSRSFDQGNGGCGNQVFVR